MNEANLHFKIKEYIMRLSYKKELIEELNKELMSLQKNKNELIQNKSNLENDYKKIEKQNKNIINICNSNNESNIINNFYNNSELRINSGINYDNILRINYKKRNLSATKPKRRLDINILKDLKKQNNELEDILIYYNHELENIIQKTNDMETSCKILMFNANNHRNGMNLNKK